MIYKVVNIFYSFFFCCFSHMLIKLFFMNLVSNIKIYLVTNRYNLKTNNKII